MTRRKISFDGWTLDCESGDLSRDGSRQRLQELPLKVLELLLGSPGGLVTRDQLIAQLWPNGVVDYDTGINTAVRKLRVALADLADAPRYIETIPRRGYRFVGKIDPHQTSVVEAAPIEEPPIEGRTSNREVQAVDGRDEIVARAPQQEPFVSTHSRRGILIGFAAMLAFGLGCIYWLSHREAATPANTSLALIPALPDHSVAVLPFDSLSTEPNNEFLAFGIAETLLNRLGSVRDLTVIARMSSCVFKNRNQDARQIGRALNARYLVEGSVQRSGERLRVQAELIDAVSGKQQWSIALDRPLADIFALQDEISNRVADQLSVNLSPGKFPASDANTSQLDAYLAFMQGRTLIGTGKIADAKLAIQLFARASQIDPQLAAAYAQESRAITRLGGLLEQEKPENLKRAIALNDRALAMDPRLGEAWVQRASLRRVTSGEKELVETEKEFQKGLDLAPNYGQGLEEFADFLANHKRLDEALIFIERARQVDPLTPRNHYLKALLLDSAGKNEPEVEALLLQALKLNPTYHPALVRLGQGYSQKGEYAKALMLQEGAVRAEPDAEWVRGAAAATYLNLGDVAAAEDVLRATQGHGGGLMICVLMIKGDDAAAVKQAYALFGVGHSDEWTMAQMCAATEMLRDALTTRHYGPALRAMESQFAIHSGDLEEAAHSAFIWGLPLAQLLRAKGETARYNRLAQSILATTDFEPSDPSYKPVLLVSRAGALAVLGEHNRALDALDNSVRQGLHVLWWIIDRGTIFDSLKQDYRYKAVAATMADMERKQIELVRKMRVAHELPYRPAPAIETRIAPAQNTSAPATDKLPNPY